MNITRAITAATKRIPTHTPALKISPITAQLETEKMSSVKSENKVIFFIIVSFKEVFKKAIIAENGF